MATTTARNDPRSDPWPYVQRLIDAAADPLMLRAHRLQLVAVDHWRAIGRPIPPDLEREAEAAVFHMLAVPHLLGVVRAAIDGPILVLKGPEIAARYPAPELRPFGDLDLLVADAERAQRALLRAGFTQSADDRVYAESHHRPPLRRAAIPVAVELHDRLSWPAWVEPPGSDALFASAVPSATGIDGVSTLDPVTHAVYVAAHAWNHCPLESVGDLVDVAVMTSGLDSNDLDRRAAETGLGRVWHITWEAIDAVLSGQERSSWSLRLYGGHLASLRDRSYLAYLVFQVLGGLGAPTVAGRLATVAKMTAGHVRLRPGDTVAAKRRRLVRAVRHGFGARTAVRAGPARANAKPALRPRPVPAVAALTAQGEAFCWAAVARLLVRTVTLEQAIAWLNRLPRGRMRPDAAVDLPPARVFAAAGACLGQSLARSQFLRRRGAPHSVVIGVQRDPAGAFAAHAWVEPYEQAPPHFAEIRRIER